MAQQDSTTFIAQLERTPDPRRARGRSFEWRVLLAIISAGLGQWPDDTVQHCPLGTGTWPGACWPSCSPPKSGYRVARHCIGSYAR